MAWWSDGTSNQTIIGERHINQTKLGLCPPNAMQVAGSRDRDCSYLMAGHAQTGLMAARTFMNKGSDVLISKPTDRSDQQDGTSTSFGSWHTGICPFVLGDGSVRSISITTSSKVLKALGRADDSEPVEIPN
jgi:hypothetical protein